MVQTRKKHTATPAARLRRFILRHPELELVERPLSGIHFFYAPADLDRRQPKTRSYLTVLNRELYQELRGQSNLFFQEGGGQFLLRISTFNQEPKTKELLEIANRVASTGFELDAAMRAAAFSH